MLTHSGTVSHWVEMADGSALLCVAFGNCLLRPGTCAFWLADKGRLGYSCAWATPGVYGEVCQLMWLGASAWCNTVVPHVYCHAVTGTQTLAGRVRKAPLRIAQLRVRSWNISSLIIATCRCATAQLN